MKISALAQRFIAFFTAFLLLSTFVHQNIFAAPLDPSEIKALDQYTEWVGNCGATPDGATGASTSTTTVSGPVYIMGDSITSIAKSSYLKKFRDMSPTVEGLGSRHIAQSNPSPSGIKQIEQDKAKIAQSRAIVIALGTNDTASAANTIENQVKDVVKEVKKHNTNSAPVYWVNVIDTRSDKNSRKTNDSIKDGLASDGKVIDWYTRAKDKAKLDTFEGGVHPTRQEDIDLLVNLVYDTIVSDSAAGNTSISQQVQKNYVTAGNITESGKTVGATINGGTYSNDKWQPSSNGPLTGHTAFLELGNGTALGELPYEKNGKPNTKLEITYKGKSIVAEKMDVSNKQANNAHYKIGLWWETAKLLGVTDNSDVKIHAVPNDTPVTPLDGTPTASNTAGASSAVTQNVACQCGTSGDASSADTNSGENLKNIFAFFVSNGYKDFQAAGIVGNIVAESTGSPQRYQGDGKDHKVPPSPEPGWGIVQWTPNSKIVNYAKSVNKEPHLLSTQLELLLKQLEGEAGALSEKAAGDDLKRTTSVEDAVRAFQGDDKIGGKYHGFERPKDEAKSLPERISAAKNVLKEHGGTVSSSSLDGSSGGAVCSCEAEDAENPSDSNKLADAIKKLGSEAQYKTTISVASVNGSVKADYSGDDVMPTRSSYKIYTAYATLRAIEDGKISWSSDTSWGNNSVEDTMEAMIVKSDNDAATALRTDDRIGTYKEVTRMLQNDVGLSSKTVMGSQSPSSPSGTNSNSTANDFVKFLDLLYKKKLPQVSKSSSYDKLIAYMKRASTDSSGTGREGIVKGVGGGTEVADKPGWAPVGADPASNDVGIVYLKNKPYVLAILSSAPNKWDNVAKIAGEVNKLMGGASGADVGCTSGGSAEALQQTVKKYAWPEYHAAPYKNAKPEYKDAMTRAISKGQYQGGCRGVDCGAFVTRVMIDSGYEPKYNWSGKGGYTGQGPDDGKTQWSWLDQNWKKIDPSSTKDLQPGDVAINAKHTFLYVGKIDGFEGTFASASLCQRAPMASYETSVSKEFTWYRKQ